MGEPVPIISNGFRRCCKPAGSSFHGFDTVNHGLFRGTHVRVRVLLSTKASGVQRAAHAGPVPGRLHSPTPPWGRPEGQSPMQHMMNNTNSASKRHLSSELRPARHALSVKPRRRSQGDPAGARRRQEGASVTAARRRTELGKRLRPYLVGGRRTRRWACETPLLPGNADLGTDRRAGRRPASLLVNSPPRAAWSYPPVRCTGASGG